MSKSSQLKLWPILCAFSGHPNTSPFIIGCYEGYGDPNNIELYLQEFIEEMKDILINGCEVTPQLIHKPLRIRLFCCDMPARAFVKDVLGHTSLYIRINMDAIDVTKDVITLVRLWFTNPLKERKDQMKLFIIEWSLENRMPIEELQIGLRVDVTAYSVYVDDRLFD